MLHNFLQTRFAGLLDDSIKIITESMDVVFPREDIITAKPNEVPQNFQMGPLREFMLLFDFGRTEDVIFSGGGVFVMEERTKSVWTKQVRHQD